MILIDTDIAVHWRDGSAEVRDRIAMLDETPAISAVTRVELENGVYRDPAEAASRRIRLDTMLATMLVVDFTAAMAAQYGQILATAGYARRKTNDRMIAATALATDALFITMNGGDFQDIAGLNLQVWPNSAG